MTRLREGPIPQIDDLSEQGIRLGGLRGGLGLHQGSRKMVDENPRKRKFEFERQLLEVKRLFPSGGRNSRS